MIEFKPFPKISRLSREIVITEKLDGTNASVFIGENGEFLTGSRTRWITPQDDNYGFSKWAHANKEELLQPGPGPQSGNQKAGKGKHEVERHPEMSPKLLPTLLIVIDLAAALVYGITGDRMRVGYWVCAAGITFFATFSK